MPLAASDQGSFLQTDAHLRSRTDSNAGAYRGTAYCLIHKCLVRDQSRGDIVRIFEKAP